MHVSDVLEGTRRRSTPATNDARRPSEDSISHHALFLVVAIAKQVAIDEAEVAVVAVHYVP
jgi:hypothetical protein